MTMPTSYVWCWNPGRPSPTSSSWRRGFPRLYLGKPDRVREEEPRPHAVQRHSARHNGRSGDLSDRDFRRQSQHHLSGRRSRRLERRRLSLRRLRLLAQNVPVERRRQRHLPGGYRGRDCRERGHLPLHFSSAQTLAHLLAAVFGLWVTAQLSLVGFALIDRGSRPGAALLCAGRGDRLAAHDGAGTARPGARAVAAADLDAVSRLAVRRRRRDPRPAVGRCDRAGLQAGLVLIVALFSFTVTQYAFHTGEHVYGDESGEFQMRSWRSKRPAPRSGSGMCGATRSSWAGCRAALGHPAGTLRPRARTGCSTCIRPTGNACGCCWPPREAGRRDTDRVSSPADGRQLSGLSSAPSVTSRDRRDLRCAGLLRDVTAQKRAQERLLHNAIHDSLTGLPNRELFLDRTIARSPARMRTARSRRCSISTSTPSSRSAARRISTSATACC